MGRYVIRLAPDEYILWSNNIDAPLSPILKRDIAAKTFGEEIVNLCDTSVTGTPGKFYKSPEEAVSHNRAGDGGERLTFEQIRAQFKPGGDAAIEFGQEDDGRDWCIWYALDEAGFDDECLARSAKRLGIVQEAIEIDLFEALHEARERRYKEKVKRYGQSN